MASKYQDYVTSEEWQDYPEEAGQRDMRANYIEHTRGLWVRKNIKDDTLEIWFDGIMQVSWRDKDNIEGRLTAMLREAVGIGERKAKKELRTALGL